MLWFKKIFPYILIICLLWGCGYHLASTSPLILPGGIRSIYISKVENPTNDPSLSSVIKTSLIDEFSKRSSSIVWGNEDNSEGKLFIKVLNYSQRTYVENAEKQTIKSNLCITVRCFLYSREERFLWDSGDVKKCESVSEGLSYGDIVKAREKVIKDISIYLAMSLSENF